MTEAQRAALRAPHLDAHPHELLEQAVEEQRKIKLPAMGSEHHARDLSAHLASFLAGEPCRSRAGAGAGIATGPTDGRTGGLPARTEAVASSATRKAATGTSQTARR